MARSFRTLAVIGILWAALASAQTVEPKQHGLGQVETRLTTGPTKVVNHKKGLSVDELLKQSDINAPETRELEIRDTAVPGLAMHDESGQRLPVLMGEDVVAVVEISDISSELTTDRSWITSAVDCRVLELWRAGGEATGLYRAGSQLTFPWQGGVVEVAGTTVRAVLERVRPLRKGGQYLVFGYMHPARGLQVGLESIYEIDAKTSRLSMLTSLDRSAANDDIERDNLNAVKARAARLKAMK